jgi:hypothetical protein
MTLQDPHVFVDGIHEAAPHGELVEGADPADHHPAISFRYLVVDVRAPEEGLGLVIPLPVAQPVMDAPLATP